MFQPKNLLTSPFCASRRYLGNIRLNQLVYLSTQNNRVAFRGRPCSTSLCVEESSEFRTFIELSAVVAVVAALDVACLSPSLQGVAVYLEQRADLCDAVLGAGFHFDVRTHG